MNILSLFDGMSCAQIALGKAGIKVDNYYASEIDKWCIKVTQDNYPDTVQMGDICNWQIWDIDWSSIDLVVGGFPCQSFSVAGKRAGFDDPRAMLFYVQTAIINKVLKSNPEAHFLVENVILDSENKDVVTNKLGVEPVYINSSLLSAQVRKRLYWFNWDQFLPTDTGKTFQSVLENGEAKMVTSFPLTATYYKRGSEDTRRRQFDRSQRPIVWLDDGSTRWLLPVECERLQTVPDGYTVAVSDTQRLKMLGNGFTVDIIAHLLKALSKS